MENPIDLAAFVFGITEVIKRMLPDSVKDKVTPLLAVLVGGGANVYLSGYAPETLVYGFAMGLAYTGLYKVVKS